MQKQGDGCWGCYINPVTHDYGLDPGGSDGGGEKWLNSGYILKVEPTELTERLDVRM